MTDPTFVGYPKIPRLDKTSTVYITEKIDGTNACVVVEPDGTVYAQSRTRVIAVGDDNFGFAAWVAANRDDLLDTLGVGRHFGEWYGLGIQRGYGLDHKRFALFNNHRWAEAYALGKLPERVDVVPLVGVCQFTNLAETLATRASFFGYYGSELVPGWRRPEGMVIYHPGGWTAKVILDGEAHAKQPKSQLASKGLVPALP